MILIVFAALFFQFCCDLLVEENVAVHALENHGFSEVRVVDRTWLFVGWYGGGEGIPPRDASFLA